MTFLTFIGTAALLAMGYFAGWELHRRRARRESAITAYMMCGSLFTLRDVLQESRLEETKEYVTSFARIQHNLWQDYGGAMPRGSRELTVDRSFQQAHEEFIAGRAAYDEEIRKTEQNMAEQGFFQRGR